MKKIIIAALLVVGFTTYAQEGTETKKKSNKGSKEMKSPEDRNQARLAKMTADLNLNASQQEQLKPIIAEQSTKMLAMKAKQKENKEKNIQLTDDEKKELKKAARKEKAATDAKIQAILTPEQFAKHQEMQKEAMEKMKEKSRQAAE